MTTDSLTIRMPDGDIAQPTTRTTTTRTPPLPPLRLSVAAHDSTTVREALAKLQERYPDVYPVEYDASQAMVLFPLLSCPGSLVEEQQQPSPRTVEAFNTFLNDLLLPNPIHNTIPVPPSEVENHGRSRSPSFCKSTEELERWLDQVEANRRRVEKEMPLLHERIQHAIFVVEQALERYGYFCLQLFCSFLMDNGRYDSADHLAFSYNGGKDCTVLLHLLTFVIGQHFRRLDRLTDFLQTYHMKTLYVQPKNPFPQVQDFAQESARVFRLHLESIPSSMKQGLQVFLDRYPDMKAICIGTRRTDPFAGNTKDPILYLTQSIATLKDFVMTDEGWPSVMRVNPILDWKYEDVWAYLRTMQVPYCCLYDRGYTSLGGRENTLPNPNLWNPASPFSFDPAYLLNDEDGKQERAARITLPRK